MKRHNYDKYSKFVQRYIHSSLVLLNRNPLVRVYSTFARSTGQQVLVYVHQVNLLPGDVDDDNTMYSDDIDLIRQRALDHVNSFLVNSTKNIHFSTLVMYDEIYEREEPDDAIITYYAVVKNRTTVRRIIQSNGRSLEDFLLEKDGQVLPLESVFAIYQQIADGLNDIHSVLGTRHQNLVPENIICYDHVSQSIMLTNYGIGFESCLPDSINIEYSPSSSSWRDQSELNPDLFSLAIIGLRMLTLRSAASLRDQMMNSDLDYFLLDMTTTILKVRYHDVEREQRNQLNRMVNILFDCLRDYTQVKPEDLNLITFHIIHSEVDESDSDYRDNESLISTSEVMVQNIDNILQRGYQLDELSTQTDSLQTSAKLFYKASRRRSYLLTCFSSLSKYLMRCWRVRQAVSTSVAPGAPATEEVGSKVLVDENHQKRQRYKTQRRIAAGSQGLCVLVEYNSEKFVLKRYATGIASEYEQEIRVLSSMNHENIVSFVDSFIVEDENGEMVRYIVTKYCDQGDLQKFMKKKYAKHPLPLDIFKGFMKDILNGIAYLHKSKYTHRDLKPANILVSGSQLKIADFGFTTHEDDKVPVYGGTASYMAPEQSAINPGNQMVDIWACGCIGFELITKSTRRMSTICCTVGQDTWFRDLWEREVESNADLCQSYTREVFNFLSLMLQVDPNKRSTAEMCLSSL